MARTKIKIDYGLCGDGQGVDPRECGECLRACGPAVFLLHQTLGAVEPDPFDPQAWRVTPMWATLCDRCGRCVEVCPQKAIAVTGGAGRRSAAAGAPGTGRRPADGGAPSAGWRSRIGSHRLRKRSPAS